MLIKIDKDRYLNPDRITAIIPHGVASDAEQTTYAIIMSERLQITAPQSVIAYLTQSTDTDDAGVFEQQSPAPLPLTSRLAIYLRNQPGVTLSDLTIEFLNEPQQDLSNALNELLSTSVIKVQYIENQPHFFHASTLTGASVTLDGAKELW